MDFPGFSVDYTKTLAYEKATRDTSLKKTIELINRMVTEYNQTSVSLDKKVYDKLVNLLPPLQRHRCAEGMWWGYAKIMPL